MAKEKGTTGLLDFSGQIQEDFLRELRGKDGYKRYNEMRLNSPTIAAMLAAFEQPIRHMEWPFVSDEGEEDPRLEILDFARDNMTQLWNDFIIEVLSMLPFGWSLFEKIYHRIDGKWAWRKFAIRGQDTIVRWDFDDEGGLAGAVQQAPPEYRLVALPIDILLLFRTRLERNNPEGRSLLRSAWIPYYYAKHLMQIEAIGFERNLSGLPVIRLPQGAQGTETDAATDIGKATLLVRNLRNDEQAGLVLPFGWDAELMSSEGKSEAEIGETIKRYESRMLMSAMAQFLLLGQDSVGSFALSSDQTDFFSMSLNAVADIIAGTFTKYAIPQLLKLHGHTAEGIKLSHTQAGAEDVSKIGVFLQQVGSMITWTPQDEAWLRDVARMPEVDVETLEELQAEKQERALEMQNAIKARVAQKQEEPEENPEQPDEDEMRAELFATRPQDADRDKLERKMQRALAKYLEGAKKRVLSSARAMKENPFVMEAEEVEQ